MSIALFAFIIAVSYQAMNKKPVDQKHQDPVKQEQVQNENK